MLPVQVPVEKKREGDNKTVVKVVGNVHPAANRQIGVEVYSRLTEWLKDGAIVVRAATLSDGCGRMGC